MSPEPFSLNARMADALGTGIAAVDARGVQTYVNGAFVDIVGWPEEKLLGASPPFVYWPPEEIGRIENAMQRTLQNDAPPAGFDLVFQHADGRRIDVLVKVTRFDHEDGSEIGWVAAVTDISQMKRLAAQQRFLLEASRALGSSLDYDATLTSVAKMAVPALADYCLIDVVEASGELRRVGIADRDDARAARLWAHWQRWPVRTTDRAGIAEVLRTGTPILSRDVEDAQLAAYALDPEQLASLRSMRMISSMLVPMTARGRTLGVITLNSSESGRHYDDTDLDVALALATRAALAVDNAWLFDAERTMRRERERAEMQLEMALKSAELGHWDYEVDSGAVFWDARYREIFQLGDIEPTFAAGIGAVHPADRETVTQTLGAALESIGEFEAEYRVVLRNGRIRWVMGKGRAVETESGMRMAGVVMDVTARRASQDVQRILAEAGRVLPTTLNPVDTLAAFVRFSVDAVGDYALGYIIEADGSIRNVATAHADPEMATLVEQLGMIASPEPASNHIVARVVREQRTIAVLDADPSAIRNTSLNSAHAAMLTRLAPTGAIVVPLISADRVIAVYAVARVAGGKPPFEESDVELLEELGRRAALVIDNGRLYQNAQAANKSKSEFLATMSHELRTPLNAMIGYTDLMLMEVHGTVTDRQREYLERVKSSALHQVQLVEGILGYSRMEAGQERFEASAVDLRAILQDVADLIQPLAQQKGLRVETIVAPGIDLISTDGNKLRQILLNLAANAVKFAGAGAVTLGAAVRDNGLALYVQDTGPGIEASKLELIFQPFVQLDQSNTRTAGGTGLGLAISKKLTELLGGIIEVESTPGRGSTFTVILPLQEAEARAI